jgi:hypothetical protein
MPVLRPLRLEHFAGAGKADHPVALDHLNPKYLDENRDDFDVENSMLACR